jgi:hypothetical protein
MSFTSKFIELLTGKPVAPKMPKAGSMRRMSERSLIELESKIGSQLFGPIPNGHRRDFFCLDKNTWVWHEEWVDEETGKKRSSTTRYEIHANGILKAQDGVNYRFIEGEELVNLILAINLYYEQVMRGIYQTDPYTGQPLAQGA